MISRSSKIFLVTVIAISLLAVAFIVSDSSDADPETTEYRFYLVNSVEGEDSTINGWYSAEGTTVIEAFVSALDAANVPYEGFTASDPSIYFSNEKKISNWTTAWDSQATDVLGANYAVWNYNAEDGWYQGNAFGTDDDTVYIISHENYLKPTGPTAASLGATKSVDDVWNSPAGTVVSYGSYMQMAPRDLKATPENVTLGPAKGAIKEYTFIINNSVEGQDSTFNGTHTGVGATPVQAFVYVLNAAGVTHKVDYNADSVYFKTGDVSDWTTGWDTKQLDVVGPQFAIWNYNAEDGWFTGNSLGMDEETVYYISHENYLNPYGPTARSLGVDFYTAWDLPADYGLIYDGTTGGYIDAIHALTAWYINTYGMGNLATYGITYDGKTGDYDDVDEAAMGWMASYTNVFKVPAGINTDMAQYGAIQKCPRDLKATPAMVVFGPDSEAVEAYTIIIDNSIEEQDSSFNGSYTVSAATAVQALIIILDSQGVAHTLDWNAASVYFKSGYISDWTTAWDSQAADILGANIAVWNYNATDGWFIGGAFGADDDTVYIISHENYYNPNGTSAKALGATKSVSDLWNSPAGTVVSWGSYMQKAPRDLKATPDKVVFGPDTEAILPYMIIIDNSIEGQDSTFNGAHIGIGTTPVQALVFVLNEAGVTHTIDYNAASVYIKSGQISDWTTAWDSQAADILGANIAIWNYNATDGWFIGGAFGADDDTVYLISHENYYNPTGPTAKALGVSKSTKDEWTAPAGITVPWGSYVQKAPRDPKASQIVLGPDMEAIKDYTFIFDNSVEGADSSFNGTHTGIGTTPVQALVYALNMAGVAHSVDYNAESAYFASGQISDWATAWDTKATDVFGANIAVWNYNAESGWYIGNTFGMDDDVVYLVSHENYLVPSGPSAKALGATKSVSDVWNSPKGTVVSWGYYMQKAPRDLKATPDKVVFGPDTSKIQQYTLILLNTVDGEDSSFNGTYTAYGSTPVQALVCALDSAGVTHKIDYNAASVYFDTGYISNWTSGWNAAAPDLIGPQFAIWNYNADDGWFKGNSFGTDEETVYLISHENYLNPYGPTARSAGVDFYLAWDSPADYGLSYDGTTGGYIDALHALAAWYASTYAMGDVSDFGISYDGTTGDYDDADEAAMYWMGSYTNKFKAPAGIDTEMAQWGAIQKAPLDLKATPDKVEFGPDMDATGEYTLIIANSVEGQDSSFNGTYTAVAANPVQALIIVLDREGVANTLDWNAASVYIKSGQISDWTTGWDSKAADVLGPNYAIWNYNSTDGWFIGNAFGSDDDMVYLISHELYYQPTGATANALGVNKSVAGDWFAPAGITVPWGSYVQMAPRDLKATPDKVILGPDTAEIQEYTIILKNFVEGQDSSFNGTYTGIGATPVQALVYVLNNAGVTHKIDYFAASVYFGSGDISDWTTAWDSKATDVLGPNFAIWNYNATDGWFIGNAFGADDDVVYLISHELYYKPTGPSAVAMGVKSDGQGGYTCPAGLTAPWGSWVQLAPMDLSATPDKVRLEPYYALNLDLAGGTADVTLYMLKENAEVPAIKAPTKDKCTFIEWNPALPSVMPAKTVTVVAVWAVAPVVEDDKVVVDLTTDDHFIMPETQGKKVDVEMTNNATVTITDTTGLTGKVIEAKVDPVQNPLSIEGVAYEFVFTADDKAVMGTSMQVTLPYTAADGKVPAVYYYNGTYTENMKVVSFTDTTVTFETTHNSTYVIGHTDAPEEKSLVLSHTVLPIVVILAAIAALAVTIMGGRKE